VRPAVAGIVVFVAAAAVLILEILAARMMAPYVGVSLNTYTGIIGTVLAGIALGTWIGGRAADRISPNRLLGPILIVGGLLVTTSPPLVTVIGEHLHAASLEAIIALSATTVFLPAFVLSGVTPIVAKMQLHDLNATGRVVGRVSASATAGALAGTFGTGFVLAAHFHTRVILVSVGVILVATGAVLWWRLTRVRAAAGVLVVGATIAAAATAAAVAGPCKVESGYFCIRVFSTPPDGQGRLLMLDDVRHSFVDLRDPRDLLFDYAKAVAAATQAVLPAPHPIDVLHIGGGAFTLPRYFAATRPRSPNTVMEIDPAVVDTARADFGLRTGPRLRAEVGDARLLLNRERPRSYDFVIGDAFAGRSPPWQLTTKQFLAQVRGVLRPRGEYLMNLIDDGMRFVRAEAKTMQEVFRFVVLLELPGEPHNYVLIGSQVPIDTAALLSQVTRMRALVVPVTVAKLQSLVGDATALDDDFAPVDQLVS
jgi:spermidine synthase